MNHARRFLALIYLCDFVTYINSKPAELNRVLTEDEPNRRIMGGRPTIIDDFPFVVSVQRRYQGHSCGGSYILPKFILSAAHCMVSRTSVWRPIDPRLFIAVAGSTRVKDLYGSNMQIRFINKVLPHPSYDSQKLHHDIGLYQLVEPFRITRFVYPSPIPNSLDNTLARTKFPICTVVGWGRQKSDSNDGYGDILRQVQVPIITTEKCRHQVDPGISEDSQLCAGVDEGGVDSCQGDSGGPILCDNIQVGLASWGIGCGWKLSPGVYTRVDHYLDWINQTVARNVSSNDSNPYSLHHLLLTFLLHLFRYIIVEKVF